MSSYFAFHVNVNYMYCFLRRKIQTNMNFLWWIDLWKVCTCKLMNWQCTFTNILPSLSLSSNCQFYFYVPNNIHTNSTYLSPHCNMRLLFGEHLTSRQNEDDDDDACVVLSGLTFRDCWSSTTLLNFKCK